MDKVTLKYQKIKKYQKNPKVSKKIYKYQTNLNLGMGEVSGGSQERPRVRSLVKETATALAGGLGETGSCGMG